MPIVRRRLSKTPPDYVLILPVELKDEITEQLEDVRDWGARFIVPIPSDGFEPSSEREHEGRSVLRWPRLRLRERRITFRSRWSRSAPGRSSGTS